MHTEGCRLCESLQDATLIQQAFLSLMAAESLNHELRIETYLKALCEQMGVQFK